MYRGRFDAGAHAPLDSDMQGKLGALQRLTFTVRRGGAIVGTTCIFYDQSAPEGVEIRCDALAMSKNNSIILDFKLHHK